MVIHVFLLFLFLAYFAFSGNCRIIEKIDSGKFNSTDGTSMETHNYQQQPRKFHTNDNDATKLCVGSKKDHRCLVSALSRIAKVRFVDDKDGATSPKIPDYLSLKQPVWPTSRSSFVSAKRFGISAKRTDFKYRCYAIRDVYMPEAAASLPAYACKLEDRAFVLTSTRFLEDRRPYVDVDIDLETYERMNLLQKNFTEADQIDVVPAMLVLKVGENNYKIRIPTEERSLPITKDVH